MVLCKHCHDRVVARTMDLKAILPRYVQANDEMGSDPSMLTISFRCVKCKTVYTFQRVLTSDELLESKEKSSNDGCGGCGG